ncbi:helix-turn-helix transcriptional regulator [Candidatus Stoquefichus sp. SB1]|uniref:helix-turn-helix transcriptional regulator n=1 Tax=Candidatus Stoquefichus sp. SB1 TaxID=1658109 RepID=UPI00067F3F49|nr:LuxR C-terminal-related transcriptional regulator [Candidatus Stoquefichus sp. SB1]
MKKNIIISAKLKRPIPRKDYIIRKPLFAKLDTMDEYTFVMIEGAAGSGKTTLMSSYIDYHQLETVKWLTLDKNFNDPFLFFQYFIEMFHVEIDLTAYHYLLTDNFMKESLYQIVDMLCCDFQKLEKHYLVLDNVHFLKDSFLCELLDMLFKELPQHIHVIMLGRNLPQIHLSHYYANHQILTISSAELIMSDEEAEQFLTKTLHAPYNGELIYLAHGWVAALALLYSFSVELHDQVMQMDLLEDYIEKEFLKEWDTSVVEFIQLTAVLDFFDENLCEYLCPQIAFQPTIQLLMHHHVLLIQLDETTYTYHDLIKEYFIKKFEQENKKQKSQYLGRVAQYYENKKDYDECLKYLLWKQDYEKMMELIVLIPQNGKTLAYLTKVPVDEIMKNADFAIQYFFYFYVNSDELTCQKIYQHTSSYIQEYPSLTVFNNLKLFVEDRIKTRINPMTSLSEIIDLNLSEVTLAIVLLKDIFLLYLKDEIEMAKKYIAKAHELIQKHPHNYLRYFYFITCAQFYEYLGEYTVSIHYFKQAYTYLYSSPHLEIGYYVGIAGVYIKQMYLKEAQSCFDLIAEKVESQPHRMQVAYYHTYIQLLYLQEHYEQANQLWITFFEQCDPLEIVYLAHILQMRYSYHQYEFIFDLFKKEYQLTNSDELDSDAHILYALIDYHQHKEEQARLLLEKTLIYCRKKMLRLNLIEINLYLILYFHQSYTEKEIADLWKEAIHYIIKEHVYLPFWLIRHDFHQFVEICHQYQLFALIDSQERLIIQSLLPQPMVLTVREKDVMKMLQKGYTNKQIAEALNISLATVKTHLINIFSKLHVNNRVEALTKYQEIYE